jgi:hypothetical protein
MSVTRISTGIAAASGVPWQQRMGLSVGLFPFWWRLGFLRLGLNGWILCLGPLYIGISK